MTKPAAIAASQTRLRVRRALRKGRSIPQFSRSSEVKSASVGDISREAPRPPVRSSDGVVAPDRLPEDVPTLLGFVLGEAHRRRDAEHVSVEAPLADEESIASRLLEHPARGLGTRLEPAGTNELDTEHEPLSPHLGDVVAAVDRGPYATHQLFASFQTVRLQIVVEQVVQVRERPPGRQRIASEGRNRVRLKAIHDLGARHDATDGQTVA